MTMPRLVSVVCALVVCLSSSGASASEEQKWTVQFDNETAVIQVTKDTEHKFVMATLTALREAGARKFALKLLKPIDKQNDKKKPTAKTQAKKLTYTIIITKGTAEITATTDLPHKHILGIINQLKESGIRRMQFEATGKATGNAVPQ